MLKCHLRHLCSTYAPHLGFLRGTVHGKVRDSIALLVVFFKEKKTKGDGPSPS